MSASPAPDLEVAGLKIWIRGRERDDATDFWDGNWLWVAAECARGHSRVRAEGPILHLCELAQFLEECSALYDTLRGEATLSCMEPKGH